MGTCCIKADADLKPEPKGADSGKSPGKSRKQTEVNPFKPGGRSIRIVQNEDGKLEKTVFKPSDVSADKEDGPPQSLVTHSLLQA